jgi:hypothetical protein
MMDTLDFDGFTPQERAGLVVWHLAHGEAARTRDIAEMTGLTHSGARKMMYRLSRRLPFYLDDDGFWQVCYMQEICLT